MVFIYIGLSIFLGMQTTWWIGLIGFLASFIASFGIGMILVAKSEGDIEELEEQGATKHVILIAALLAAAFLL